MFESTDLLPASPFAVPSVKLPSVLPTIPPIEEPDDVYTLISPVAEILLMLEAAVPSIRPATPPI